MQEDYKTNIICKFNGLCWDEAKRSGIDFQTYAKAKENKSSDFCIELTIKDSLMRSSFIQVQLRMHFWNFYDDIEYTTKSQASAMLVFDDIHSFLKERNIVQYIKDELEYHCGIKDERILDTTINAIVKEIES